MQGIVFNPLFLYNRLKVTVQDIRYENGCKNGLISKLNARFGTHFPAVLICYQLLITGIRHKSDVTCALDRYSQSSLMLSTVAGDTAGKDLASLGYVSL